MSDAIIRVAIFAKNAIFEGDLLSKKLVITKLTQLSGKTQFLTVQLSGFNCIKKRVHVYSYQTVKDILTLFPPIFKSR